MNTVITPVKVETRQNLDFRAGDTVRVWQKIEEKGKTRLQAFEGLVLARKHGKEAGATFTVRRMASGVGVEKIFPLYSPNIDKIEVLKRSKVRRSKLYHIREKAAKEVRRQMRNLRIAKGPDPEEEELETTLEETSDKKQEANGEEVAGETAVEETPTEETGDKEQETKEEAPEEEDKKESEEK